MIKKTVFLFAILAAAFSVSSQTILLEEDVAGDTLRKTNGPNLKHYSHSTMRFGLTPLMAESGSGAAVWSPMFDLGFRYKRKICNYYALGFDFNYFSFQSFTLNSDTLSKHLNNDTLGEYQKENIQLFGMGIELYNRFNFDRRGNHIGKYLDLGVYADFAYAANHNVYVNPDNQPYGKYMVSQWKLDYINRLNYGVNARVGINRWVLFAKYRISNLFKEVEAMGALPELSRLSLGVEIGLF